MNILIRTQPLVKAGYINSDERDSLNEIYDYNPLLFDFVLKRTIRSPGTNRHLPASLFMTNPALGV
jgi:mannonate dehydratase